MTNTPASVLIAAFNGRVFGLDVGTGATLWSATTVAYGATLLVALATPNGAVQADSSR
jgi:hypothetical protein